jgi:hypothetical protein
MDFPLNKLPPPKYTDKPAKHKKTKKSILVSHIDYLFDDLYLKNYFKEHKKTHQKKDTRTKTPKKIDSKKTKIKSTTE